GSDATNPGPDDDSRLVRIGYPRQPVQTCGAERFVGRHQRVVDEQIHAPGFLVIQYGRYLEVLYLGGDAHGFGQITALESCQPTDAGATRLDITPRGFDIVTERGD